MSLKFHAGEFDRVIGVVQTSEQRPVESVRRLVRRGGEGRQTVKDYVLEFRPQCAAVSVTVHVDVVAALSTQSVQVPIYLVQQPHHVASSVTSWVTSQNTHAPLPVLPMMMLRN